MTKCFPLFLIFTLLLADLTSAASDERMIRQVDELIARYVQPDGPGCALAVIQNDKVIYQQTYGMMNLEYDLPVSCETVFNLGSVSKQFTAACVLLLANENRLSLNDDIHTYLPDWPDYGHKITIRHLLHHTSGIVDYDWLQALAGWKDTSPGREYTLDLIKRVKNLNFPPGEAYYYSNSGYLLLSLIVERVSGMPLSAFAAQHIFKPLGMERTLIHDDAGLIIKQRADSYMKTEQGGFIGLRGYQSTTIGDNNVYTTIGDMIKWDENFRKETVGGRGFARQMFTRGILSNGDTTIYAMGLVIEPYRGLRSVSHGGLTQGYKSHYLQFPDQR
ncbi:serine hydrolase, partial [candidate division KSB1 bacterium]|nr:serine hydrolase [candidate division KSB1 bacterium]